MKPRIAKLLFVLAIGSLFGMGSAAFFPYSNLREAQRPNIEGLLWLEPKVLEPFALIDHHGERFALEQLRGRWSLLFFGYTHCPDVCPTTLAQLDKVASVIQETPAAREDVQFVFVSVDSTRDTPARLADNVTYFNQAFIGATDTDEELIPLTRQLGIYMTRDPPDARGDYLVGHSAAVLLIDPAGRLVGVFQPPHESTDVAQRFERIRDFVKG